MQPNGFIKRMNDKIDLLFNDLKEFQNDVKVEDRVIDSYYGGVEDNDMQKGIYRSESTSSRDTLNSLYSNPISALKQQHTLAAAREARLDQQLKETESLMYITPPSSSSNSMILPSSVAESAGNADILNPSSDPGNSFKSGGGNSRKRNGIININTLNLLEEVEEELYNLTPPRSPTRKISAIIIPPRPPPSRKYSNQLHPRDLEYSPTSSTNAVLSPHSNSSIHSWNSAKQRVNFEEDGQVSSWINTPARKNSTSSGRASVLNLSGDGLASSSSSSEHPLNYDSIPKTELLKRAAGGALKASNKKLTDYYNNFTTRNSRDERRISASNSYSYQERRSIDSSAPSLFDIPSLAFARKGSNASVNSTLSNIPTFKRNSSNLKVLKADQQQILGGVSGSRRGSNAASPLSMIPEEESESGTLKRALSWPRRKPTFSMAGVASLLAPGRPSVADVTLLSGYESVESFDTAIFSLFLLKKNRRGQFQKRLIRCDGTLLVCMSSLSAYIRKGTISEYDLLESPHDIVRKDLYSAIRDYYPPGTAISSLARNLISAAKNGTSPDPESKIYFVPKWIIPVSKITKFQCKQTVAGAPTSKDFTIHSSISDTHTFQAYSLWEVGVLKEMIVSMVNQLPDAAAELALYSQPQQDISDVMSDSVQVSLTQQISMHQYMSHQAVWKRVVGELVRSDYLMGPKITTLQIDASGAKVFRGLVMEPPPLALPELLLPEEDEVPAPEEGERLQVADFASFSRTGRGIRSDVGAMRGSISADTDDSLSY